MEPVTLALCAIVFLLALLFMRVPISAAMLLTGFIGLTYMMGTFGGRFSMSLGVNRALGFLGGAPFTFITSFTLVAVPLFLLMGNLAYQAKATSEAFDTARVWFGRVPGSLALATIAGCGFFAAICGSSLATAAAMGRFAVPQMLRAGYDHGLAGGTVAAGGTLGALIPPSILMVIYAAFTEQSVGRLLVAGLPVGLLTAILYMLVISFRVRLNPRLAPVLPRQYSLREKLTSLSGTAQFILLFIVVMGSIYAGVATPTEASAFGVTGVLAIGLARRKLDRSHISTSIFDTLLQTSSLFAIAIGAKVFVGFIAYTQVSTLIAETVGGFDLSPILLMLSLSVVYIILGMFMDPLGIMLLTLPVVIPLVLSAGYEPVWFGVLMVKYLEIGMITPPLGLNVFVLKSAVGKTVSLEAIFKGVAWFLIADVIIILLMVIWPSWVMWLPNLMYQQY